MFSLCQVSFFKVVKLVDELISDSASECVYAGTHFFSDCQMLGLLYIRQAFVLPELTTKEEFAFVS